MELGSFDGGEDGKLNSDGLVELSKIFVTQYNLFLGMTPYLAEYTQSMSVITTGRRR